MQSAISKAQMSDEAIQAGAIREIEDVRVNAVTGSIARSETLHVDNLDSRDVSCLLAVEVQINVR